MSEPKNANEIITQAAIRWYGPAFTLGSAGFGGFILEELKANGYAVVPIPSVLHKGPHDTDSTMYAAAADRLDRNYGVGGSNLRRAISQLLKYVSAAAAERDSEGRE